MNKLILCSILFLVGLTFQSCENKNKETAKENSKDKNIGSLNNESKETLSIKRGTNNDSFKYYLKTIDIENVLINGHKIILTKSEFDSYYKKIDSTKTYVWECGSPFESLDEKWMTKTYGKQNDEKGTFENFNGEITTIFCKDIEFSTNKHIVLFDRAFAQNNSFKIISKDLTLDKNTTLKNFKKTFPNVEMEELDNKNESRFRLSLIKDGDGAFLFYFKNGKLDYFTLWFVLC
jgi:hypothetical protein